MARPRGHSSQQKRAAMVMPIGTIVTATNPAQRNSGVSGPNAVAAGRSSTYHRATAVNATNDRIARSHSRRSGWAERRGVIRYQWPSTIAITDAPSATADAADAAAVQPGPSEGL